MVENASSLCGMKEICDFMGKSRATMVKLIKSEDFPATKIAGEWTSDKELIAFWRRERIKRGKK